jgi:uncharacterized membrane protein HdeD (DUF308 family)
MRISAGRQGDDAMSDYLAQNWWAIALRGVVAILFGVLALLAPGAVMLSLALLFAAYLLVDGVFAIIAAGRAARSHERWGLLLAEGILDLVMGVIAAMVPAGAVLAFVLMTAAWALLTGGLMVAAAFRLNPQYGRWWMVAADRGRRADVVARRLRHRVRRHAPGAGVQTEGPEAPSCPVRHGRASDVSRAEIAAPRDERSSRAGVMLVAGSIRPEPGNAPGSAATHTDGP